MATIVLKVLQIVIISMFFFIDLVKVWSLWTIPYAKIDPE